MRPSDSEVFKETVRKYNEGERLIDENKAQVLGSATDFLDRVVHQTQKGTRPRLSIQEKLGHAYMDATSPKFSISGDDLKQLGEVLQEASLFSIEEEDGKCRVSITVPDVMVDQK